MADEKKSGTFPFYTMEFTVRFYRETDVIQRKVRITEETLADFKGGPIELATNIFRDAFEDVWRNRDLKKGEEKK